MEYKDLFVGQHVCDGPKYGIVRKIYKKTVHVHWSNVAYPKDYWIYDLEHLQFLSVLK